MSWKVGKSMPLYGAQEIACWKEKINTEQRQVKHETAKNILMNKDYINTKNNYIDNFKHLEAIKQATKSENFLVYDQATRDKKGMGDLHLLVGTDRTTKGGDPQGRGFCQKCKRESLWCQERKCRDHPKEVQAQPLTSA